MSSAFVLGGFLPLLMMMGVMSGPANVDPEVSRQAFNTIAQHLEEGGSYYQVEYTEGVSRQMVDRMVQMVSPHVDGKEKQIIESIQPLLAKNGFFALKGRGASVKPVASGLKHTRMFWMVDKNDQKKPLWQAIYGQASDPADLLQYLPEQTELCLNLNADTQAVWGMVEEAILTFGAQGDRQQLDKIINDLREEEMSPVMLAESLTGRGVFALQLDPDVKIPLPVGREMVQVPMPSFVAVLGVRSDAFQTELTRLLLEEGKFSKTTQELAGQSVVSYQPTQPMPIPLVISFLRVDDLLVIGSNLGVMEQALTVAKSGGGLVSRAPFQSLPTKNMKTSHGMFYVGANFARLLNEVRDNVLKQPDGLMKSPAALLALLALLDSFPEKPAGWILTSDEAGYLLEGRGNGMLPMLAGTQTLSMMLPMMASVGFRGLHSRPQDVRQAGPTAPTAPHCINNLRMIDFAKETWALESGAMEGETPKWEDLTPYIKEAEKPQCPQGGTYSINPLGTDPQCSIPGHKLP